MLSAFADPAGSDFLPEIEKVFPSTETKKPIDY